MRTISCTLALAGALLISADVSAERGRDGELRILYWQAPTILNPYLSGGTKDLDAASLVLEPLARYDDSGVLVPWLAASVPTVANGGISDDRKTVTWTLREGLRWSDGSPVTAADEVCSPTISWMALEGSRGIAFSPVQVVIVIDFSGFVEDFCQVPL